MDGSDVTPNIAIQIINLPQSIGVWEKNNQEITIDIGKYGPYIKCENLTRSVPSEINLLELTVEQASELLSTDKSVVKSFFLFILLLYISNLF